MEKSGPEDSIYYCWDNFRDWCGDMDISLHDIEETAKWRRFWECWKKAIDQADGPGNV